MKEKIMYNIILYINVNYNNINNCIWNILLTQRSELQFTGYWGLKCHKKSGIKCNCV